MSLNETRALIPGGHTPPIGRYCPGIEVPMSGNAKLIFITGQVASDDQGQVLGHGDAATQTRIVFSRIKAVLNEAGAQLKDLVMLTLFVCDPRDILSISRVRDEVLPMPGPSSTLVVVSGLAMPGHLVEINGIAVAPGSQKESRGQ